MALTQADVFAALTTERHVLDQVGGLVYTLYVRVSHLEDSADTTERAARAHLAVDAWNELDELGVDLAMDELKTAVFAIAATAPRPGRPPGTGPGGDAPAPPPPVETPSPADPPDPTPAD